MKLNLAQEVHTYPILSPADIAATATYTNGVRMSRIGSGMLEIGIHFGAASATDSTGDYTVTMVESSGVSTDGTAIPFYYRLSAAAGSDDMGDLAAVDSTGSFSSLATAIDNCILLCYVDPNVVTNTFVHALITPSADSTSCIVGAVAKFVPRYAQDAHLAASTT